MCGQCFASVQPCNACPEVVLPEITYEQIGNQILEGNYQYALDLAQDLVLQELREVLNDPKQVYAAYESIKSQVDAILYDSARTENQKAQDVTKLIDSMLESYSSPRVGELDLSFSHSIEFGTTRLSWDKMTEIDECVGQYVGYICYEWDGGACLYGEYIAEYWVDYVRKIPDYYIYRIVDGQEKLITKLSGHRDVHRESMSFSSDIYETVKSVLGFDFDYSPDLDDSRALFYDVRSDLRGFGTTLQYRVVATNAPYKYGECGSSEVYDVAAYVDQDGDGRVDFIPNNVYSEHWGRGNGWLVPIIRQALQ
jgi:hypothetical protein